MKGHHLQYCVLWWESLPCWMGNPGHVSPCVAVISYIIIPVSWLIMDFVQSPWVMWEELSFSPACRLCLFPRAHPGKNSTNANWDRRKPLAGLVIIAVNKDLTPLLFFSYSVASFPLRLYWKYWETIREKWKSVQTLSAGWLRRDRKKGVGGGRRRTNPLLPWPTVVTICTRRNCISVA